MKAFGKSSNATTTGSRSRAEKLGGKTLDTANQRRALMKLECERRGVRFLPGQVMREIYERNGLL